MNYLIVYDKFETVFTSMGLAVLENASGVKIKEIINGEYLLSFILPPNDPKWQYIQPENFLKVNDQLFRVRGFDEQRDSSGKLTSNIQCEHAYYDSIDCRFFPDVELIGQTPAQILTYAFSGTRFTIGTVEISTPTDIILSKVYSKQIVEKLIENVGGELVKDNWSVNLVSKRGSETGVQFRYGKNVSSLKRTTDAKNVVTRLYPYGKDGLQIAGELGYIDSPLIGNYDRPKFGFKDYSDIDDPSELLTAAQAEWSTYSRDGIDKPYVTYSGEFLELKKLQEYGDFEAYSLGDTIRVIDDGLGIDTLQRIMEYEYYPYEPKRSTVVLANVKPSVYRDNRSIVKIGSGMTAAKKLSNMMNGQALIATYIDNVRKRLQTEVAAVAQKALMHSDADLYVDNTENPTKAILLGAGVFAIANSKTESGDWNWRTIATGDKVVADEVDANWVYAGTIKADQIDATSLHVSAANVDGELIGKIIMTAALNAVRMELKGSGLTSYNAANQKEGFSIESGLYGFSRFVVYVAGVLKGGLSAGGLNALYLETQNGINLIINPGAGTANRITELWDCSMARFADLRNGSGDDYITLNEAISWINSQGFLTSTTGASGMLTDLDGNLFVVSNGLITDIYSV